MTNLVEFSYYREVYIAVFNNKRSTDKTQLRFLKDLKKYTWDFYNDEIEKRRDLRLPPFTKMIKIIIFDTVEEIAKNNASSCRETLLTQISQIKKKTLRLWVPYLRFHIN